MTTRTWLSTAMGCSPKLVDVAIVAFAVRMKMNGRKCSFMRRKKQRLSPHFYGVMSIVIGIKQIFQLLCQYYRGDILDSKNTQRMRKKKGSIFLSSLSSHDNLLSLLGSLSTPSKRNSLVLDRLTVPFDRQRVT